MKLKLNWDGLGIFTSILCAIHCGLLPLLIPTLPLLGVNIIHNATFEWVMIFIAIGVGFYSLYHGYKKHHHQMTPIYIFGVGMLLLIVKEFYHHRLILLIPAVIFIITAHYRNYKLCARSKCSSLHHKH
jgi:4-amino-4-deoxy-L-arabinose transferase-like glycosyltransferase